MKLNELLTGIDTRAVSGDLAVEITGIHYDSRDVNPGSMFVAVHGERFDGNRFVHDAVGRGAAAIVSESPAPAIDPDWPAWIEVPSDRRALSSFASRFFQKPTARMRLVGVTGTNGKTTTAHIVESVLSAAGRPVAILGTIGYRFGGAMVSGGRTTPEAPDLERMFSAALEVGCRDAVMEVSSHALALHRVDALDFDVAVFTNLTGDHLDFHGDMNTYFESKKRLFTGVSGMPPRVAVLNRDDPRWVELVDAGNARVVTYGLERSADVYPIRADISRSGVEADVRTPSGNLSLKAGLVGWPNLYNICATIAVGEGLGLPLDQVAAGIGRMPPVPGRFQSVDRGQEFGVFVDYAHTDDALAKVLDVARDLTTGRLIVVFGAGGGRDTTKRARMGEAAGSRADLTVVTSDNPRDEDPNAIIAAIESGLRSSGGAFVSVPDRRSAIREALQAARAGDVVVIAGKGHERFQAIGNETLPFNDGEVAHELLGEMNESHA
jgi:UDP-N-acetylmuramoyl-L-alanyl-D-glutamate--2,6-diaminopimelate ligase